MIVRVFGRSGCARTGEVLLRLKRWLSGISFADRARLEYYDLETAEGLAEAAYQQLEGDLPVVLVVTKAPGLAISGDVPFRSRVDASDGDAFDLGLPLSWN